MKAKPAILGVDIGGANLKAAHTSGAARTVPFALWKHPERLAEELRKLGASMPALKRLAITMTGELCDCFANKREGVGAILDSVRQAWPKMPTRVWTNRCTFVDLPVATAAPLDVAAANWLALALFVGQQYRSERVLLFDCGSTTTDITYINRGQPEPHGLGDPERLASGALVYTGVRRTPISSVLGFAVTAELFATMQDAYVWRGLIPEDADDRDTADGRPRTRQFAHARLARMLGADCETFTNDDADRLADAALQSQWTAVGHALQRILRDRLVERIVLAGSGEILARSVCTRHRAPQSSLAESLGPEISVAACAYAVAMLEARV